MRLTTEEMTAIVKMVITIGEADDYIATEEKRLLFNELNRFSALDDLDYFLRSASKMSYSSAIETISDMPYSKKKYVSAFLAAMVVADREPDSSETRLWAKISRATDLPFTSPGDALDYWVEKH